ncbi:GPW/gp25 family protein [Burkholderia cepacia]|uniref:GPW/gp25 family protein n=1 Tax=Burkholderia cepacia TaxID=292 RepID=UPI000753F776|nr:GPW/gp25 family protein [Burkholderia cepacia]KVU58817.1 baseplate protein [Burkholderia cepacia]
MTQLSDITSVHWQPALNREGVVEGVDDIDQAIRLILGTPQGSDPHRPEFGSRLYLYLDMPIDRATPHVVRESIDAIRRWEPRCEVVRVIPSITESRETIRVQWRLADGVIRETEVPR